MRPSDWLIAEDLYGRREYLVHLAAPRFIARLVDGDDFDPVGIALRIDDEVALVEFVWLDAEPGHDGLLALAQEVRMALAIYEERLEADVENDDLTG